MLPTRHIPQQQKSTRWEHLVSAHHVQQTGPCHTPCPWLWPCPQEPAGSTGTVLLFVWHSPSLTYFSLAPEMQVATHSLTETPLPSSESQKATTPSWAVPTHAPYSEHPNAGPFQCRHRTRQTTEHAAPWPWPACPPPSQAGAEEYKIVGAEYLEKQLNRSYRGMWIQCYNKEVRTNLSLSPIPRMTLSV